METIIKIQKAFDWLNEDLIWVAMIGIVDINTEDLDTFERVEISDLSFEHYYEWSKMMSEDTAYGEILIPLIGNLYMKFEFNS